MCKACRRERNLRFAGLLAVAFCTVAALAVVGIAVARAEDGPRDAHLQPVWLGGINPPPGHAQLAG